MLPTTRHVLQPLAWERAPAPQPTARAEAGLREEQESRLRSSRRAMVDWGGGEARAYLGTGHGSLLVDGCMGSPALWGPLMLRWGATGRVRK